ncbi:MAG TPA: Holliday junction resolvase RuvX [Bacteroidota bacterium]|nr:Holliday junction resolvase RuvX [Bacteroidota bacterium]
MSERTTGRYLGIDFGSRRIGLSLSDPLGIIARPYETVGNDPSVWNRLREIIGREQVVLCVVGMPLNLKGEKASKAKEVDAFVDKLKRATGTTVILWDERFTTAIAQHTLREMNVRKKGRDAKSGTVDAMAAAVILQSYLDSRKNSLVC